MAFRHEGQRVGLFVDAQNMYHSAKNLHGGKANFAEIFKTATNKRMPLCARIYVVTAGTNDKDDTFFDTLANQGYDVQVQDLRVFSGGAKKADWDVGIAVDVMRFASKLDVVVLATGDGDFVPLVEYLQYQGVQVEVIGFKESSAHILVEVVDEFVDMSADAKKFILKK